MHHLCTFSNVLFHSIWRRIFLYDVFLSSTSLTRSSLHTFSSDLSSILRLRPNRFQIRCTVSGPIRCTVSGSVRCTVSSFRFRTTQQQREQSGVRAEEQAEKTQSELGDREGVFERLDDLCGINIAVIHCCKDLEFERIDFFVIVSISLIESDNVFSMRIELMST